MSPVQRQRPGGASPLPVNVERPRVGDSPPPPAPAPVVPESESRRTVPRYLTMERVDARLREDQALALGNLARRLQRSRRSRGERITSNTLLRVAADLLLARAGDLAGDTEDELRASLGLPYSGSSGLQA